VVNVTPFTVPIVFSPYTYSISFSEGSLPAGTVWNVTVGAARQSSEATTLTFNETNGTYSYTIDDVAGWHQTTLPYSGSLEVEGAPVTETLLGFYRTTYALTFSESGLPLTGIAHPIISSWTVLVNGSAYTSTDPSFQLSLPNGSYPFHIDGFAGYHVVPVNGTAKVDGGNLTETVRFTAIPTASSPSNLGEVALLAAIGTAAVVVGIGLFLRRRRPSSHRARGSDAGDRT
jgi:hypothetical protein